MPTDIQAALRDAKPGDTVWVEGGVYTDVKVTLPAGVTLRALPNHRVVFDSTFIDLKAEAVLWGINVTHRNTTRRSALPGSAPTDLPADNGVYMAEKGTRVINCVILNTTGISLAWFGFGEGEVYGSILGLAGWIGPDREHGPTLYSHNKLGGRRSIRHTVFLPSMRPSLQLYSGGPNHVRDYDIQENVFIGGRLVIGANETTGIKYRGNHSVETWWEMGRYAKTGDIEIMQNHHFGLRGAHFGKLNRVVMRDNLFTGPGYVEADTSIQQVEIGGNRYFLPNVRNAAWQFKIGANLHTDTTKLPAPWEQGSQFSGSEPTENQVFVYPNEYEWQRGMVTIWNWERKPAVEVDLSALKLLEGKPYRVHNPQNLYRESFDFTYTGAPVAFPMTGWTLALPRNLDKPMFGSPTTFPRFGAFIVAPAGALGEDQPVDVLPS
ncbi:MAG: hypothetical protein SF162_12770 [bacterium]|nr:hypothetical protein [bacterium]